MIYMSYTIYSTYKIYKTYKFYKSFLSYQCNRGRRFRPSHAHTRANVIIFLQSAKFLQKSLLKSKHTLKRQGLYSP